MLVLWGRSGNYFEGSPIKTNAELSQSNNIKTDYSTIASALTWRYAIALSLVATLSTAAWISLHLVIMQQQSTAALVNVSGRQRMLSQRAALFSNLLVHRPKAERPAIRSQLKEAIDLMAHSHDGLIHGNNKMGLPDTMSRTVHTMYFDGPNALDRQVIEYIKNVQALLQQDDEALTPDNPLLLNITNVAPTTLVHALDQMVHQYQLEGETSVKRLQKAETTFWLFTLVLLILEAALIFHPFARHVRTIFGALHAVTIELQMHKERLEELVRQRTADLESRSNELAVSESHYRTLVEHSPFCIFELDTEGRLHMMNQAGLDMMGLTEKEKISDIPFLSSVSKNDTGRIESLMREAFNGTPNHFEFTSSDRTFRT